MPSLYLSNDELAAIQYGASQLKSTLETLTDPTQRAQLEAHLAQMQSVLRKGRNADSARTLKQVLRQRHGQQKA